MRKTSMLLGAAFAALAFTATPALAQEQDPGDKQDAGQAVAKPEEAATEEEEPSKPFEIEFDVTAVSDYRFRGISLSDKDPAFQPSVTVSHESGLYASVWASTLAENDGDDLEVDLVFGFAPTIGGFDLDVNATYYVYPGAKELNYWEFIGTVSHAVGPATVGAIFAYTPEQDDAAPKRGIYYGVNGELPIGETPFTLTASFGIEDNAFYDKKKDWSLGVSAEVEGFNVGLSYVDTSHTGGDPLGKAGLVFSLGRTFTF